MTTQAGFRKCSGCDKSVETDTVNTTRPVAGLDFPFRAMGYYSGFTDCMPWEEFKDEEDFVICHDCVVKVLSVLPAIREKISEAYGRGLHPTINSDDSPCCEYCWKTDSDGNVYLADENLQWEKDQNGAGYE